MKTYKTLKKDSKTYTNALIHFRRQFKDVVKLTKLYLNDELQVIAGEWIDSKGVINFNSGYLIECKYTVTIK